MHPGGVLRFRLEYDETIHKHENLFGVWLDASYSLQRLNPAGLEVGSRNIEILVEYDSPPYLAPDGSTRWQIDRLRDAADFCHMQFIRDWFPKNVADLNDDKRGFKETQATAPLDGSAVTNNAVLHYRLQAVGSAPAKERLAISVRDLFRKRLLGEDIDKFRKRLVTWPGFAETRDPDMGRNPTPPA
ncbi:MAG: hypothetical protein NTV86_01215 [Planctomycetota bacterium]|nr:hypothetical protein [Planctomycetota bacterium]